MSCEAARRSQSAAINPLLPAKYSSGGIFNRRNIPPRQGTNPQASADRIGEQEMDMLTTESFHDVDYMPAPSIGSPLQDNFALSIMDQVPGGFTRQLRAREHIYFQGDHKTHVYQVEKGALSLYKILADGRRQVIDFALPGDLIGLGSIDTHNCSAQATVKTTLRCLSYDVLHRVARDNPAVGMHLYEVMSEELAAARDLLVTVGQRSAMQRVVTLLLALSNRNDRYGLEPDRIVLPMTRGDIADFLGLTIETVSRTFTKLKVQGLIRLGTMGRVRLLDVGMLENLCSQDMRH